MSLFIEVALPIARRRTFTYSVPATCTLPLLGSRVQVPFGKQRRIGFVTAYKQDCHLEATKIRSFEKNLDPEQLWPASLTKLFQFTAQYYFASIGQIYALATPKPIREGLAIRPPPLSFWKCTPTGLALALETLHRSPKQQAAMRLLQARQRTSTELKAAQISSSIQKTLQTKGWIEAAEVCWEPNLNWQHQFVIPPPPLPLNAEQQQAIAAVPLAQFQCCLLDGVTGSGKTEVYMQIMARILQQGRQVLVMVPEIALTPQMIERFQQRFQVPILPLHSKISEAQKTRGWQRAWHGEIAIVIGTRSALFTPLWNLGLIVVDEEHDSSFKQQEQVRFHARDLAIMRAQLQNIPIILGSATPSFESLRHAYSGRYLHLKLNQRAGKANPPTPYVLDIRGDLPQHGLSSVLRTQMTKHLARGHQVFLFLNRRGFAPALLCQHCGKQQECQSCDAAYALHQQYQQLQCHHCGDQRPIPHACSYCGSAHLQTQGIGTEQVEKWVQQDFPDYSVVRIDRDTTRRHGRLEQHLQGILSGEYQIMIGTQMLAKGHHFPKLTMVVFIDIDHALFHADFRATEKLAQLYTQVSGRSGRAHLQGEVFIQTRQPQHPVLQALTQRHFSEFAQLVLRERHHTQMPPYATLIRFQSEAQTRQQSETFIQAIYAQLHQQTSLELIGPLPAHMTKKAGRFRHQLLIKAPTRQEIHHALYPQLEYIERQAQASQCQFILDCDPIEMI